MSDWTSGYVADIGYTFGYYSELNPLRGQLAFMSAGLTFPTVGAACELGFGQGMSTNLHAAATDVNWYGTDFNPSQAGFARDVAEVSGAKATLSDQAFDEFCSRTDLPDFDFIGLHGIWSWISDENRHVIVDFLRRKLKVGGVLYISYNTQPGWAAMVPMRDLLTEHNEVMGAPGQGIVSRIDDALTFADKLIETNPNFVRANPLVAERIKKLKTQDRNYLAHEYFNRDWCPMPFSKMAAWLAPAKLSFACPAAFLDHIDTVNLTPQQQVLINEIPDPMFRETVRDFMINQQFRREYWVRGARQAVPLERGEAMMALRVMLMRPRAEVTLKTAGPLGEVTLQPEVYDPILDALADFKPHTLGEIQSRMPHVTLAQVMQAIVVLAGMGAVSNVQSDAAAAAALAPSRKLNHWAFNRARGSNDVQHLASPVLGGGFMVGRFQQLFLLARQQGHQGPEQWARFVWQIIKAQNQKIIKDGVMIDSDEANLAEMTQQAREFDERFMPLLKALQIAD
jgi:SAM-dependent methyltransferase